MDFVIITDSSCDLPLNYIEKNKIPYVSLICHLKNQDIIDDFGKSLSHKKYYNLIRSGELTKTSPTSITNFTEIFRKYTAEGKSIIYIGLSSGVSGCINIAHLARKNILENFPHADITIIDSKSTSMGLGLLVQHAREMQLNHFTKNQIVEQIKIYADRMNHLLIVDNLNNLKHGGRISSSTAILGSFSDSTPILKGNSDGRLVSMSTSLNRTAAMNELIDTFKKNSYEPESHTVAISHGDCLKDAKYLENALNENFKIKNILITSMGPVISSHTGINALGLFYLGNSK